MTIRYDRPVSRSAYWARRLAIVAVFLFFTASLSHRFGSLSTPMLLALVATAASMALLAVLLALKGLHGLWQYGARGGMASVSAILLALIPIAPMAFAIPFYILKPAIGDITTDVVDAPRFLADPVWKHEWLPAQKPVGPTDRQAQMLAYREISGRRYEGAMDRVLSAVLKVGGRTAIVITHEKGSGSLPGPIGGQDDIPVPLPRPGPDSGWGGEVILQGETRSPVFGFYSDVVIRLREEPETTLVDIRVASRFSNHDLGSGSRFIQRYFKALDAELLGIAGD